MAATALVGQIFKAAQQLQVKVEALPDQDGGEPDLPAQHRTAGLRLSPSTMNLSRSVLAATLP